METKDYENRMMSNRRWGPLAEPRSRRVAVALARTNARAAEEYLRGAERRRQIEQACSPPSRS